MDDDDMMIQLDPIVARGDLLIRLVKAMEETKDDVFRALLAHYAVKVDKSIQVPDRKPADLYNINGDKLDA